MLMCMRRRDNKYQKVQMVEPARIVAAACADSARVPKLESLQCDSSPSSGSGFNGAL